MTDTGQSPAGETRWTQKLRLGVPEMDTEHGLQVGLVEALEDAVAQGREHEVADGILEKLVDLTNAHFLAEELMMRLHRYPSYEAHVAEHDRLVDELRDVPRSYAGADRAVTLEDIHTLRRWLASHVETKDRAFAQYLSTRTNRSQMAPGPSTD